MRALVAGVRFELDAGAVPVVEACRRSRYLVFTPVRCHGRPTRVKPRAFASLR
jgi:hypothetical protein